MSYPSELRISRFSLLVEIASAEAIPIRLLAEHLGLERTTLFRKLQCLESGGLVRVLTGRDRRTRLVALTEPGAMLLPSALSGWRIAQSHLLAIFRQQRWEALAGEIDDLTRCLPSDDDLMDG
ncbi:MAG: MarR family transcriptional regulator [Gemmatimonadetes bacterium]|nr:MarR family transcriptional regulator [Gemmatimonadota bacterium]